MLVLSRRVEESLKITTPSGEEIEVKVIRLGKSAVSLGIIADRTISVVRSEIAQKLLPEGQSK